jgi:hypothetical protein
MDFAFVLNGGDQVFSSVPNPNLFVLLWIGLAGAERRSMAGTKSCQYFDHVVDGEFIGQRLEPSVWGEVKRHLRDREAIQHHVSRDEAIWMRCFGLIDVTEMGVNLIEGHAPCQTFNASLYGLDSPEDDQCAIRLITAACNRFSFTAFSPHACCRGEFSWS